MASFSKTFLNTFTEAGIKTVEVEVNGVIYSITPKSSGNSYCGYAPFSLVKQEGRIATFLPDVEEGCIDIPGGQIQVHWEVEDGEVTDDLNIFFFDYEEEDKDRVIHTEYI